MKKCKKISNFLACLALALMMSCFLFNTTVAQDKSGQKIEKVYKKKTVKQKMVIKQQKEIKARIKRIEKKIIKRNLQTRSGNYDDPTS